MAVATGATRSGAFCVEPQRSPYLGDGTILAGTARLSASAGWPDAATPDLRQGADAHPPPRSQCERCIPADRITLGGLPFVVSPESRAKDAVLFGLHYSGWQSWSYAPGARLRLAHSLAAELKPTHGYHHGAASLRLCAEQPVADWTWADACLAAGAQYDGLETTAALTTSLGARRLFQSGAGFHQMGLTLASSATADYTKEVAQLSHLLLTENAGMWSVSYARGEEIPGENTLRRRLSIDWTGEVARRPVSVTLTQTKTGGARLFGLRRDDRKVRLGATLPMGQVEIGGWIEHQGSTIDAYRGAELGLSVRSHMNLL